MSRNEFLSSLEYYLRGIPEEDKKEILYDYKEHFTIGMEQGKTEEEIAQSLGDVRAIARQFRANYTLKEAEINRSAGNIVKAVIATVALGFFNLIAVLGPFIGLIGIMAGLIAASIGITAAGIGVLLASVFSPVFPTLINFDVNYSFAIFTSIGVTCLGLLMLIGCFYLAKLLYKGTVRYLKWNIDVIKK
jgi:uncharacterized membrane protein